MNSSTTRAVWLEVDPLNKETTIADAINNWCSSNANVQIESIKVYQEHITKYKALIIYNM
jgi:serine protease inhibitor